MVTKLLVPDRRIVVPKPPSYLKLNMAFGVGAGSTLFDKSRYRSHGTIVGAAWATGLHGKALDFDPATPSYVEIPASYTQLNFTSEKFSIICRLRPDIITPTFYIFNRGLESTDGYILRVYGPGAIAISTSQSGAHQLTYTADNTMVAGTRLTIGISRDGATCTIYKDGVDVTFAHGTHIDPATCARSAKLGIYDNKASGPYDGLMEFSRVFGGIALSASEHLAYHNALA